MQPKQLPKSYMNDINPKKKVGLAISGGWIRAAAAIGAAEVLQENGIDCVLVSGCSAGSVVASAYAVGNIDKLKKRFLRGSFMDYWSLLFEPANLKNGFSHGKKVMEFWKEFVGEKKIEDLDKKLFLAATDLSNYSPVILSQGQIAPAIQACINLPGMFVPFKSGEKILADGGYFNLIPSQILYDNGADYVIAIDVSKQPNLFTRFLAGFKEVSKRSNQTLIINGRPCLHPNIFSLSYRALKIYFLQTTNFFTANYKYDILIRPEINHIKRWNISKVDYLIKRGREAALKQIVQIKHDLGIWQ